MTIDPTQAKEKFHFEHPGILYAMCADRERGLVFAGGADRGIHVFDLREPKVEKAAEEGGEGEKKKDEEPAERKVASASWAHHANYVSGLALVRRERPLMVSASYDRTLAWWDAEAGSVLHSAEAHDGWVRAVEFLPGGRLTVSAGDDMRVKLWESDSGKLVREMAGHARQTPEGFTTALYCVAVSPDGQFLASADRHGEVRVWETETGALAQRFACPKLYTFDPVKRSRSLGGIRSVAFSPGGNELAVAGIGPVTNVDGFVGPARLEVWDWQQPRRLFAAQAEKHKAILNHVAFHPGGEWVLAAGGGDSGGILGVVRADAHLRAGKSEAEGDEPKESKADGADVEVPLERVRQKGHVQDFEFSADGQEIYMAGHEKVEVWSLAAGEGEAEDAKGEEDARE